MKQAAVASKFYTHYQNIYGHQWPKMALALEKRRKFAYMLNPFIPESPVSKILKRDAQARIVSEWTDTVSYVDVSCDLPSPLQVDGLRDYYALDPASLLPVKLLQLQPAEKVLDLCASPGGKTLAILFSLYSLSSQAMENTRPDVWKRIFGQVVANEMNPLRFARLSQNMSMFIPPTILPAVALTKKNGRANLFGRFDKVLVDAPCSTPRHSREIAVSSTQKRQVDLLRNAVKSTREGGKIVYSTCSLDPFENDQVIQIVLQDGGVRVQMEWVEGTEETEFGRRISIESGFGPMYTCILNKI
jgi:16S rRNA C967 or C1407 C5-methylase (RsmB/RsmF family)